MNQILNEYFIPPISEIILYKSKEWENYNTVITELGHGASIVRLIRSVQPVGKKEHPDCCIPPSLITCHIPECRHFYECYG